MKLLLVAAGALVSFAAIARGAPVPALNLATFNPVASGWAAGRTDWKLLGESDSKSAYYTFARYDDQTAVGIKVATKGLGADFTQLQVVTGSLQCIKPGEYPSALEHAVVTEYNPVTGAPIGFGDSQGTGASIPVERGTLLAKVVVKACDAVASH